MLDFPISLFKPTFSLLERGGWGGKKKGGNPSLWAAALGRWGRRPQCRNHWNSLGNPMVSCRWTNPPRGLGGLVQGTFFALGGLDQSTQGKKSPLEFNGIP